jgi:hypothetical protein
MGAPTPAPAEAGMAGGEEAAPDMGAPEAGAELAAPTGAEASREKRESIDYSRRLGLLLNSKKK